jgi:hypothetical protein
MEAGRSVLENDEEIPAGHEKPQVGRQERILSKVPSKTRPNGKEYEWGGRSSYAKLVLAREECADFPRKHFSR